MLPRPLIDHVLANFGLALTGIHGVNHWSRVRYNGLVLQRAMLKNEGIRTDWRVIELFAFIHDSQRSVDHGDIEHGPRAADWCYGQNGKLFNLEHRQLQLLAEACADHTTEIHHDNPTIQVCWDSDRLDIGRCKEFIDATFLNTSVAKQVNIMSAALKRSRYRGMFVDDDALFENKLQK